ncbi:MAG TPA: phosphate signaling complex protein PhoU [Verrucomicrobiota bacterium]|nr:phosphate signaling complex protein PhoU [Verrucomicrobiota bacterium]
MVIPTPHLEQSLQRDIDRIKGKVNEMGELCEVALKSCLKSFSSKDRQLAYSIILRDQFIDEHEKEIDRLCLEFLVRQQPVGSLLRFAYATIKINLELERVGDYAETIARQTLKLIERNIDYPVDQFKEVANLAIPMFRDSIKAFLEQNPELASKTIQLEDAIDLKKRQINAQLVDMFSKQVFTYKGFNPLIQISRRWERVSDQARNICMETLYMCTGDYVKHPGSEAFRILFVDEHNSCRSQMAEAIANSLNQPRFIFSSAGINPQPVEARTIEFLKTKGHDISRVVPKSLVEIPNLDHYNVIVALAPEVRRVFPQKPRKTIFLDWSVKDPSKVEGNSAQVLADYEEVYDFLKTNITDLVNAVINVNGKDTNRNNI